MAKKKKKIPEIVKPDAQIVLERLMDMGYLDGATTDSENAMFDHLVTLGFVEPSPWQDNASLGHGWPARWLYGLSNVWEQHRRRNEPEPEPQKVWPDDYSRLERVLCWVGLHGFGSWHYMDTDHGQFRICRRCEFRDYGKPSVR